ncbi:LysR family transcriptional regulator [Pararhodobacter sp. SW119]|uniref:LysR family transcriptional regulator n=1 Tax=Pararhodobacter sp. SW119 TaxID=2780075 RepID=UPI001AE09378|nr:LysR family transcriptional regulator [Pararhodobacter sp. SW119]
MARFDEIEIFAAVVECGTITGAAERLRLSKSRVSEAVMGLEARLGARLLDRTTRRVTPTEAGGIFYERCRRALDEAQAGVAEVMARQDVPVGHLRIGAPEGFADRYVVPALSGFLAAHPQITVEVIEDVRVIGLVENRLDLSIRVVREPEGAMIVRRLGGSQVVVCASPAFVARNGEPECGEDVARFPIVGFAPLFWAREWRFRRGDGFTSVPVAPVLQVNSTAALRAAVLADIGMCALPVWAVTDELASGRVVRLLSGEVLPESGIYAVYPSNRLVTTKVRRFVDYLAPVLRQRFDGTAQMVDAAEGCR